MKDMDDSEWGVEFNVWWLVLVIIIAAALVLIVKMNTADQEEIDREFGKLRNHYAVSPRIISNCNITCRSKGLRFDHAHWDFWTDTYFCYCYDETGVLSSFVITDKKLNATEGDR